MLKTQLVGSYTKVQLPRILDLSRNSIEDHGVAGGTRFFVGLERGIIQFLLSEVGVMCRSRWVFNVWFGREGLKGLKCPSWVL